MQDSMQESIKTANKQNASSMQAACKQHASSMQDSMQAA
jgi:hypothetical protein